MYPEPYRQFDYHGDGDDELSDVESGASLTKSTSQKNHSLNKRRSAARRGSISIDFDLLTDEREDPEEILEAYFKEFVVPLAKEADKPTIKKASNSPNTNNRHPARKNSDGIAAAAIKKQEEDDDEFERLRQLRTRR